ncbi:hypothetical protein TUM4261_32020 [Shewanella sp. c952]|uniref:hypothetical protein n=1 Tax=Shewanella sp. c952 TaxID=2815913 RepID=UPI001BC1D76C|nr:hypothetical protein [Shewanella sp. c952]GIU15297.1 hypothetical protein TUM4261_32020 [Shewanella sp. c952]
MKNTFKVLFIDDNDVSDEISSINRTLKRHGKRIDPVVVDVSSDDFFKENVKDGKQYLSEPVIIEYIKNQGYMDYEFDIVACDFNFSDDYLNGYQLLVKLINHAKQDKNNIRKARILFYTGEVSSLTKVAVSDIQRLLSLKVDAIVDRPKLIETIVRMSNSIGNEFDFERMFLDQLDRHSDKLFYNTYPQFHGKTIDYIRNEVDKETDTGKKFVSSLVEQTVAHMIDLQDV